MMRSRIVASFAAFVSDPIAGDEPPIATQGGRVWRTKLLSMSSEQSGPQTCLYNRYSITSDAAQTIDLQNFQELGVSGVSALLSVTALYVEVVSTSDASVQVSLGGSSFTPIAGGVDTLKSGAVLLLACADNAWVIGGGSSSILVSCNTGSAEVRVGVLGSPPVV